MKNEQKPTEPSHFDRTENRLSNDPLPHEKETVSDGRLSHNLETGRKGPTQRSEDRFEDDHKSNPEE
ncbi:hypothetical protein V9K67_03835 [Paraflavisolibacter sp. H34]|uniref:hypothetical protein n=1 Tax=Huijunlia imazamoxiresistens TaxID=3127457 RepID=UPI0030176488